MLTGNVLITGGAGFLARAIYRRAEREEWPVTFTAVSRDEAKHAVLQQRHPNVRTAVVDVALSPREHLAALFAGHDVVIHAAASKYVDRGELQALTVIETNVTGSVNAIWAAAEARVPRVVAISTDKAVKPVNTYGMTKAVMERAFTHAAALIKTTAYTTVRYGNVVGSTGSVVPIFQRQWAEAHRLRLTDPSMTRFWMSPDEAVNAVLVALEAPSGVVVVPPARAQTLHDLALTIMGYDEHRSLPPDDVEIMGTRPGEKRHESLLHAAESLRTTVAADGYRIVQPPGSPSRRDDPYTVTSNDPPGGWMGPVQMMEVIADAARLY